MRQSKLILESLKDTPVIDTAIYTELLQKMDNEHKVSLDADVVIFVMEDGVLLGSNGTGDNPWEVHPLKLDFDAEDYEKNLVIIIPPGLDGDKFIMLDEVILTEAQTAAVDTLSAAGFKNVSVVLPCR